MRKLIMLGAAPETRGSASAAVEAARAHGVFRRWPAEFIATYGDGGPAAQARLAVRATRSFGELIGRHGRAVVHAHWTPRAGFWRQAAFMAAALAARCALIVQLHGGGFQDFHDRSGSPVRALMRFFFERAACIVVPYEAQRAWLRSVARDAHVAVVPPAVGVLQPGERGAAISGRPNLVLFLGRLEAQKGVFDLVEAIAQVRRGVPDVRLVCAGDGDREAVRRFAEQLGVSAAVKFTGWVGASGKRALLESAAVLALPSYGEGMPVGLLEGLAAGVPVVATPVGGVPEAVCDGVSGLLVAPGDRAALARALQKLLSDRALGARLGTAARESARLRFAPERTLARLEALYAETGLAPLDAAPEGGDSRGRDLRQAA